MTLYTLQSFVCDGGGGNAAGVVLDADALTPRQMQEVARRARYPETAFVCASKIADRRLRFFTPTQEVSLCGHATVAAYALMYEQGLMLGGEYTQETAAGVLAVEVQSDGMVFYDQELPRFLGEVPHCDVSAALRIPEEWIRIDGCAPQIVSTGMRDIFVRIDTRKHLFSLAPDFIALTKIARQTNTLGMHVFTLDTMSPSASAHSRDFGPAVGTEEDAATGSATGALACILYRLGMLKGDPASLLFEQGHAMGSPSALHVKLAIENGTILRVRVGGEAKLISHVRLSV